MNPEQQNQLLRRFEPVLSFTRGELFFPMDVEPYVHGCSLLVEHLGEAPVCLAEQNTLTLESLAKITPDEPDVVYYLRFIEPLDVLKLITYFRKARQQEDPQNKFRVGIGRLARVGYSSRFADLIFSLTLLLRGRVPGDSSAAAAVEYERIQAHQPHYAYHGRVIRQQEWLVLQYWYFYAFNNWRSGFYGVNDHEADWELISIYLYEGPDGNYIPEWIACSEHESLGDDLRRRWDDPELIRLGEHPVIYVGAGSHANYFLPGEYQKELQLPIAPALARFLRQAQAARKRWLGGNKQIALATSGLGSFRVPFVDFARGDGVKIGPGQEKQWAEPRLLEPAPEWVKHYAGLWGLYVQDPVAGENAPAGPMYNRDGKLRLAWYNPLGWAGLDKIPPPNQALIHLQHQRAELIDQQARLEEEIHRSAEELTRMGIILGAIRDQAHIQSLEDEQRRKMTALSLSLNQMYELRARNAQILETLEKYDQQMRKGQRESVHAHIRNPHRPASPQDLQSNRTAEIWAAISIGLMMITFVGVILFLRQHVLLGLAALITMFISIEALFRKQLPQLINRVAIGLAIAAALVMVYEFFWQIVILSVLSAGLYVLWENLRELSRL